MANVGEVKIDRLERAVLLAAMENNPVPATTESEAISRKVRYELPLSSQYNPRLRGSGELKIFYEGPTYEFSGKSRGLFRRTRQTLSFDASEVVDVIRQGRMVSFGVSGSAAWENKKPFVFHCETEEEAVAVVELLPDTVSLQAQENRDFMARLNALERARSPWRSVTGALVVVNALVFLVMAAGFGAGWIDVTNMMPYILYGANNGAATTDDGWWRLVTSMFMHYGIVHVTMNMWALYSVGPLVEKLFGRSLYLLTYLVAGVMGGFASIIWHGDKIWSAGASGAIFGVYGALLGYLWRQREGVPKALWQSVSHSTLGFVGYNVFFGFVHPGIDNAAHLGGLATGVILGWLLALPVDVTVRATHGTGRLRLGLAMMLVLFAVGVGFSPRFDYHIQDEISLQTVNVRFSSQEQSLMKEMPSVLSGFAAPATHGESLSWIENKALPLYRSWAQELTGLELASGLRTDRERVQIGEILRMRVASFEHLAAAKDNFSQALQRFTNESSEIMAAIKAYYTQSQQAAQP